MRQFGKIIGSFSYLFIFKFISFINFLLFYVVIFIFSINQLVAQTADIIKPPKDNKPISAPNNSAQPSKSKLNDQIEINFNELELVNLIDLISKATGKVFLYEDNVKSAKKVTILSNGSYSLSDANQIFENILDINGYSTIKEGPYIRIINKNDAKTSQTPIIRDTKGSILTEGDYVTMVYQMFNTNVNNIRAAITPFLTPSTLINQFNQTNSIILRDTRGIIDKTINLIKVLDQRDGQLEIGRFYLKNSNLTQVVAILNDIFLKEASFKLFFYIDAVNYSIITIANKNILSRIEEYIVKLDKQQNESEYKFINLKYSSTSEVIKLTNLLFPQEAGIRSKNSPVTIVEEKTTNRLLIIGPIAEISRVENFIKSVDIPTNSSRSAYNVFKLNNTNSEDVAKTLQQITSSVTIIAGQLPSQSADGASTTTQTIVRPQPSSNSANSNISIVSDSQTNSLVVFASPTEISLIEKLIGELDQPQAQVFLEVMILEVSLEKSLKLGINWKAANTVGNTLVGAGLGGATNFLPTTASSLQSEAISSQLGALGPNLTYQGQTFTSYSAFIQATKGDTDFNLISNPQILTVSNKEATIKVGEVRPFQTSTRIDANNNVTNTYEYKEVGVTLKFTARIGQDNSVLLKIDQSTKNVNERLTSASSLTPTTFERNIVTNIVSKNNEIVVLGGLISENGSSTSNKTWCLGDIPLIGWLFKNTSQSSSKTNLLVYIRPTIVRSLDDRGNLLNKAQDTFESVAAGKDVSELIKEKVNTRIPIKNLNELPTIIKSLDIETTNDANKDNTNDANKDNTNDIKTDTTPN